jgi:hypothetical protein
MRMLFAALHESVTGTSRHFAATPDVGRFHTEADMNRQQDRLHRSRMTLMRYERLKNLYDAIMSTMSLSVIRAKTACWPRSGPPKP